jgi:hypothetical protein
MTAYHANLPWSAALGGELGGARGDLPGFARVLIYPNGGTGIVYRRSELPDRGSSCSPIREVKAESESAPASAYHWSAEREQAMRTRSGKLTRVSGTIVHERPGRSGKLEKIYVVQVRCDCGGPPYEVGRSNWISIGRAPRQCIRCHGEEKRIRSFTARGHEGARAHTAQRKAAAS